ncbi:MAG: hypothetical protein ACRDZZ_03610 [Ilumatobacteraceae bacterium]
MAGLQTEYPFTLPKGYVDGDGTLHRHGIMRMATARDEIEPLRDARINSADDPYLTVLVLARVITELGSLPRITPNDVEGLFAADLAFLQDLYGIVNFGDPADVAALQATVAVDERLDAVDEPAEPEPVVAEAEPPANNEPVAPDDPTPSPPRRGRIEEVPSRSSS